MTIKSQFGTGYARGLIKEIEAAGFAIEQHRIITETISGSVPISRRKGFGRLLDKMEKGDVLVVTKLDRLGRDAIDVSTTVSKLEKMSIKVYCLALGGVDRTSSAGKMTMGVINNVAQFERDLLIERTQSGLARAKSNGKTLGRPKILSESQKAWCNRAITGRKVCCLSCKKLQCKQANNHAYKGWYRTLTVDEISVVLRTFM